MNCITIRLFLPGFLLAAILSPGPLRAADGDGRKRSEKETSWNIPKDPGKFHVFLLMGQSNMAGFGPIQEKDKRPEPRVVAIKPGDFKTPAWKPASRPLHDGRLGGYGLGISFARTYAKAHPGVTVGLIPLAWGGTPIRQSSKGSAIYADAVRLADFARRQGTIQGVLWHQGESDTVTSDLSSTYAKNLDKLVADLRGDLGLPGLPFVVGNLAEFYGTYKDHNAQARVVQINEVRKALWELPKRLPHTGFVETTGLKSANPAMVHFDPASYDILGQRYAKKMNELLRGMKRRR